MCSFLPNADLHRLLVVTSPLIHDLGRCVIVGRRLLHNDGRSRLSNFWTPTGGIEKAKADKETPMAMLIRGGFVRPVVGPNHQPHAGLFQMLPLGLKVQEKLEKLIDRHMRSIGASKLSLSTFSSEALWRQSGRLQGDRSELFHLEDRKGTRYLLSPTHEEEITALVGSVIHSFRELPLRLYQISRKYRDELRPRKGLLRAREFIMKDLYTFDQTPKEALQTYQDVQNAYSALFDELKLDYFVAEASSGNIGGNLSHEYHFVTESGEDTVLDCDSCSYVANDEVAVCKVDITLGVSVTQQYQTESGFSKKTPRYSYYHLPAFLREKLEVWISRSSDRRTLYQIIMPRKVVSNDSRTLRNATMNHHHLKNFVATNNLEMNEKEIYLSLWNAEAERDGQIDTFSGSVSHSQGHINEAQSSSAQWQRFVQIFDLRIPQSLVEECIQYQREGMFLNGRILVLETLSANLLKAENGDACPKCNPGTLLSHRAVELGHTFYLGTKYSEILNARIGVDERSTSNQLVSTESPAIPTQAAHQSASTAIEMGCHGIGVSRMIAAVAEVLADAKGLKWPRVMAPFEVIVISTSSNNSSALEVFDHISGTGEGQQRGSLQAKDMNEAIDVVLDDRVKEMPWKMKDADLIGYPIIVIVGRAWKDRKCEVQCRSLNVKEVVPVEELYKFVRHLLIKL